VTARSRRLPKVPLTRELLPSGTGNDHLDVSLALIDPSNFISRSSHDGTWGDGVLNDNILHFAGSRDGGHAVMHKRRLTAGQDHESRTDNKVFEWHGAHFPWTTEW